MHSIGRETLNDYDRAGVERLLRYCARPPFALERLYAPGGIACLTSGHPPEVGRPAHLSLVQAGAGRPHQAPALSDSAPRAARDHASRCALIPPGTDAKRWSRPSSSISRRPRAGTRRRWVARLRAAVVDVGRPNAETPGAQIPSPTSSSPRQQPSIDAESARPTNPARRAPTEGGSWAVLLARIYEVLPLLCPACGGQMRILAFLTRPARRRRDPGAPRAAP